MKLTIYHGTNEPFIAIGKHQCNLLDFAFKYPTWHYYNESCKATKKAIDKLISNNVIILNSYNQFKINL
jgi:hypothetical protein